MWIWIVLYVFFVSFLCYFFCSLINFLLFGVFCEFSCNVFCFYSEKWFKNSSLESFFIFRRFFAFVNMFLCFNMCLSFFSHATQFKFDFCFFVPFSLCDSMSYLKCFFFCCTCRVHLESVILIQNVLKQVLPYWLNFKPQSILVLKTSSLVQF